MPRRPRPDLQKRESAEKAFRIYTARSKLMRSSGLSRKKANHALAQQYGFATGDALDRYVRRNMPTTGLYLTFASPELEAWDRHEGPLIVLDKMSKKK